LRVLAIEVIDIGEVDLHQVKLRRSRASTRRGITGKIAAATVGGVVGIATRRLRRDTYDAESDAEREDWGWA
jgi:hypothetical protein